MSASYNFWRRVSLESLGTAVPDGYVVTVRYDGEVELLLERQGKTELFRERLATAQSSAPQISDRPF
jgi:hypothetical protein